MEWFLSLVRTKMDKKYRKEFSESNIYQNRMRSIVISLLIIVLEVLILANSFRPTVQGVYGDYVVHYRLLYIAMIVASILVLLILKKNINSPNVTLIYTRTLMIIMVLFINWAAIISIVDSIREIQSSFYMFIALSISVIIIMRPMRALILYASSLIIFLILTYALVDNPMIAFSNYINSLSVYSTAWIISMIFYKFRTDNFMKQKIIYEQNIQLKFIASIDPLTGILNRRALETELNRVFSKSVNEHLGILVMMIDIDYFKGYNDTYGHIKGDEVLVLIANTLRDITGGMDNVISRYGGDEFCLILQCDTLPEAHRLRDLIHEEVRRLAVVNEASQISRYITISIGLIFKRPSGEDSAWGFIREADKDLYSFKSNRMNRRMDD